MFGIGSLVQPQQAQPQQAQPQQAQPPMPPRNDPRMAAAMDVVQSNVPEPLQQLVDENVFAKKAMELLQSAGGQAAMDAPAPQQPTVADRVGKNAQEGVSGLLRRLSPGIQQQGQQMAMAQRRPPMQGQRPPMQGQRPPMPQQGMAQGGIVGYAPGGDVNGPFGGLEAANQKKVAPTEREEAIKARTRELMGEGLDPFIARRQARAEILGQGVEETVVEDLVTEVVVPPVRRATAEEAYAAMTSAGNQSPTTIAQTGIATPPVNEGEREIGDIVSDIQRVASEEVQTPPVSGLRKAVQGRGIEDLDRDVSAEAEAARIATEKRYMLAAAQSPEMIAANARFQQEEDAYYKAQLDPAKQRRDEFQAMLKGFATPGGIAASGIAATEGVAGVRDGATELGRTQSKDRFSRQQARGAEDRKNRLSAFDAGNTTEGSTYAKGMEAARVALQSLTSLAVSDDTKQLAANSLQYTKKMDSLKVELQVLMQQDKIDADDRRNMSKIVQDMRRAIDNKDDVINKLNEGMLFIEDTAIRAAQQNLINNARTQSDAIQRQINGLLGDLGVPTIAVARSGGGGDSVIPPLPAGSGMVLD